MYILRRKDNIVEMIPRLFIKVNKRDILTSLFFSSDADVGHFESEFARYIGVKHAKAVYSGRTALRVILDSMDIGRADEVIVPALCCTAVAETITDAGACPVLSDVDAEHFTLDVQQVSEKIGKRTKAIVAVHLFGNPCEMHELRKTANEKGVLLIEDCAQALGATYKGRKVGIYGDVSFFSLGKGKNITAGEGGIICTDDSRLFQNILAKINSLKYPSVTKIIGDLIVLFAYQFLPKAPKLVFNLLDNYFAYAERKKFQVPLLKFPAAKALIARKQLTQIDQKNERRAYNSKIINEKLGLRAQRTYAGAESVYLYHAIISEQKDKLKKLFRKKNIDVSDYGHLSRYFKKGGYAAGDFPTAEYLINTMLFIPNHELVDTGMIFTQSFLQSDKYHWQSTGNND